MDPPHKVQSCSGFIFSVLGVDSTGGGEFIPLTRFSHAVVLYSVCWEWTPLVVVVDGPPSQGSVMQWFYIQCVGSGLHWWWRMDPPHKVQSCSGFIFSVLGVDSTGGGEFIPLTRFSHAVVLYSVCWEWTPLVVVVDGPPSQGSVMQWFYIQCVGSGLHWWWRMDPPHKVQSCSGFIFSVLGVDSTGGGEFIPLTRFSHAVVLYSVCWEWTPLVVVVDGPPSQGSVMQWFYIHCVGSGLHWWWWIDPPHKVQSCSGFIFSVLGVDSTGSGGWVPSQGSVM